MVTAIETIFKVSNMLKQTIPVFYYK